MTAALGSAMAVMPVHNEAATIGPLVQAVRTYLPVLVVDDASNDGSGSLAAAAGAEVITLARHAGKGAALRCGFAEAIQRGAASIITLDGDGQHDPSDIPRFLAASRHWPDHLIVGNRLSCPAAIPLARLHAIQVASFWINWIGQCEVQDTQSGFRLYPAAFLQAVAVQQEGFVFESALLVQAGRAGWGIQELPILAVYPPGRTSHYRPLQDGIRLTAYLLARGLGLWPVTLWQLWRLWRQGHAMTWRDLKRRTGIAALATLCLPLLAGLGLATWCGGRLGQRWRAAMIRGVYDPCLFSSQRVVARDDHGSAAALPRVQVHEKGRA